MNAKLKKAERVAIYFRYSKQKKNKDGTYSDEEIQSSERRQKSALENYALEQGWKIVFCDGDKAVSGDKEKPVLNKLKQKVSSGELVIDVLLVDAWDRLTRKDALEYQEDVKWIRDANAALAILDEGARFKDLNNNQDLMLLQMKVYVANQELKDKAYRITSSLKEKARNGTLAYIREPFGYYKDKHDNTKLVPSEDFELVKEVFEHFVSTGYVMSCMDLIKKSKTRNYGDATPTNSTIKSILRNPIYIQKRTYGVAGIGRHHQIRKEKTSTSNAYRNRLKIATEVMDVSENVPRCISDELFYAAQRILDTNEKQRRGKKGTKNFLFKGMLRCKNCGRTLAGETLRGGEVQYACWRSKNKAFSCSPKRAIKEKEVLDALSDLSKSFMGDKVNHERMFVSVFRKVNRTFRGGNVVSKKEWNELDLLETRFSEMKESYRKNEGIWTSEDIKRQLDLIDQQKQILIDKEDGAGGIAAINDYILKFEEEKEELGKAHRSQKHGFYVYLDLLIKVSKECIEKSKGMDEKEKMDLIKDAVDYCFNYFKEKLSANVWIGMDYLLKLKRSKSQVLSIVANWELVDGKQQLVEASLVVGSQRSYDYKLMIELIKPSPEPRAFALLYA